MVHRLLCALLCASFVSACATPAPTPSVYDQLGGEQGVHNIVDDFVYLMATDERTKRAFEFTDFDALKVQLNDQFCMITGGPCAYGGRDMVESHKGLDLSDGEFNAGVELLQQAMIDNKTPLPAQNRLLALLAPMHGDIVHK